ncbi:MAG: copper resistance CopC family protein [Ilumatobacteraceae bacterium]
MKRTGLGIIVAAGLATLALGAGPASAHDSIASSDPASGSTIDDPISEVTIDFGEGVANPEMAVFGPDDEIVESVTVQISDTAARAEFDELQTEGIYIVRYLAPVTADGHTLAGAIQFTYGSAGGDSNVVPILLFCAVAILILSIGAYFSWRRYRQLSVDQEPAQTA